MPNIKDLSPEELTAFRKWSSPILAGIRRANLPVPTYEDMLQDWLDAGRPGYTEPWKKAEEVGEGPFYVDEYPEPPHKLGEGFEWVEVTSDPATGRPTRPQWVSQPVGAEGEEPWKVAGFATEEDYQAFVRLQLSEFEAGQEYRQWQMQQAGEATALERERFEWQMSEAALGRGVSQRERELADRLRLQQELAQLGGPADWVKRWEMMHGVIPRAEAARLQERALSLLTEAQDLTGAERTMKEMQAERLFGQYEKLGQQMALAEAPPSPEWLPQFVGTQVAGEPITKGRTTTPSGQQWTRTPWSVREGLRGYTEFAGFRPYQDILEHMAQMAPRTPVGAGRTRWAPATQRT